LVAEVEAGIPQPRSKLLTVADQVAVVLMVLQAGQELVVKAILVEQGIHQGQGILAAGVEVLGQLAQVVLLVPVALVV
jgi:hypothetical protein